MRKWFRRLFIFFILVLQYRIWVTEGSVGEVLRLKQLIQKDQLANQKLVDRNDKLDLQVRALKHQPQALEEQARSELGMIKKDETFYLIIDPKA